MSTAKPTAPKRVDPIPRGNKGPSPLNTTVFVALQLLRPLLQYNLLSTAAIPSLLSKLGRRSISTSPALTQTFSVLPFSLSSLSTPRLLLLGASTLSVTKQLHWAVSINQEALTGSYAVQIPLVNAVLETLSVFLYFWRATSPASAAGEAVTTPIAVGAALAALGCALEWGAELQRRAFKADPRNRGKVHRGGPFAWARHINYTGFVLFKAGEMLMGGGWGVAAAQTALQTWDFVHRAIPVLDEYCESRYGGQWRRYRADVPRMLVPGLY